MATVAGAVKESLIGVEKSTDLTQDARARFLSHATQGDDGEYSMSRHQFIDAIAPA